MSWTVEEQRHVGTVLLGSWPSQVAAWGREAIAAYVAELQGRGLTAEQAIGALRSCEATFPPSAGELFRAARVDPALPTFDEALFLIRRAQRARATGLFTSEAQMLAAIDEAALEQLRRIAHPLVVAFAERQGMRRLASLELDDPEYGELRRRELRDAWDRHLEACDGREVAAIAAGRRDGLQRLDPLAAIAGPARELPAGDGA